MADAALAGAFLDINLGAIQANYRRLCQELGGVPCAAVVKADAYGTGTEQTVAALWDAGARVFFTAHIDEGIRVRTVLPDAQVHILNGVYPGAEPAFIEHNLIPVLNSLSDVACWRSVSSKHQRALPCDLHLDTGMCRLGLDLNETAKVFDAPDILGGMDIKLMMSHLASGDDRQSPQSQQQLVLFREIRKRLPIGNASFANSPGVFLGPDFHFDLARPGVALYGVNPAPHGPNPMRQVVGLKARILQVRDVDSPETVGYGASHAVTGPTKIATLPIGYADGYLRSLSGRTKAWIGEHEVSVVGRVSMDLITIDVTGVPDQLAHPGALVDLICANHTVDDLAADAGTIGYEILTSLGNRYHRQYLNEAADVPQAEMPA